MSKTINSVVFDQNGFKGITVKYLTVEKNGAFSYPNEYQKKCVAPVHAELKKASEPFVERALNVCHLNRDKMYETELVSVVRKNEAYVISIKCKSDLAKGWYSVSTPLLTEGDYGGHAGLEEEWRTLSGEVEMYVDNTASASNRQLVMEFAFEQMRTAKSPDDLEEFKNYESDVKQMTEEEILEEAREIIEKRGGVMYTPEDLGMEPVPAEVPKKKGKQLAMVPGGDELAEGF